MEFGFPFVSSQPDESVPARPRAWDLPVSKQASQTHDRDPHQHDVHGLSQNGGL